MCGVSQGPAVQKAIDLSSSNSKIILPGSFLRGYYIRTLHSTRVEPSPKRGSWIATSFVRWCQCRSSTSHKTCRNDNHDKKYSSNLRYCCCRCCCGHQWCVAFRVFNRPCLRSIPFTPICKDAPLCIISMFGVVDPSMATSSAGGFSVGLSSTSTGQRRHIVRMRRPPT